MTDQTMTDGLLPQTARPDIIDADGFFVRPGDGLLRTLYEDFRAVPTEAWVILAVATVMSNLFIALA